MFTRAPVPGQSKTRLIPLLGAVGAAAVHERLLRRTLSVLSAYSGYTVQLWCTPDPDHPVFAACVDAFGVQCHTQCGDDLGARMAHALHSALHTRPWAIVVGTDCPGLLGEDIEAAVRALDEGVDAVLGPAVDGGYYLLGLRHPAPALFKNIPWGSDTVLALTRQRLRVMGRHWWELPERHDLDEPDDLCHFPWLVPMLSAVPSP